jgi:DNA-binding NarL/FixJ family response regulator
MPARQGFSAGGTVDWQSASPDSGASSSGQLFPHGAAADGYLPAVTRRLISEFAKQPPRADSSRAACLAALTPRETQVLRLVAEGLSNPEIAARFTVTEETVKTHVSHILAKLGLRDRTQAVVTAYETGLVVPGSREPG